MKLLIISHTAHYQSESRILGWGATVRERDHLGSIFDQIVHLPPLHDSPAPDSAIAYQASNVVFHQVKPAGGDNIIDKLGIFTKIPGWLAALRRDMKEMDAIHIRCPAGISLVALLAARLWGWGKPVWVKYAGNWRSYPGQALSYKFQRFFLKHNLHRGVVTINGHCPGQPEHIYSFVNPSFSDEEFLQGSAFAREKQFSYPIKLLFVGNLSRPKGVDRLLEIAKKLNEIGFEFDLTLVGDGPDRPDFERFVKENSLAEHVHFAGWQPITAVHKYYREAHIFVFPSKSEGWPKVLSEAMSHGVVPIASGIGSIPEILEKADAGHTIPLDGDPGAYVEMIISFTQDVDRWKKASLNGIRAAKDFTYEQYLKNVKKMFWDAWRLKLDDA